MGAGRLSPGGQFSSLSGQRSLALSAAATRRRLRAFGLDTAKARSFAVTEDLTRIAYAFHTHRKHQLLYAMRGTARLESRNAQFLLPPQRAAWIPAGLAHAMAVGSAEIVSVYFDRDLAPGGEKVIVFDVPPLLREMLLYAARWPSSRNPRDRRANVYFDALLGVVFELMRPRPLYELPRARTSEVARAMEWVFSHLESVDLAGAARFARTSPRTLRRRLGDEAGLGFRAFVSQARLQRAVDLLASGGNSILDVALEVGFASPSAFSQAFRRATGQAPRDFRTSAAQPGGAPALARSVPRSRSSCTPLLTRGRVRIGRSPSRA